MNQLEIAEHFKELWENSVGRVEIRGLGNWSGGMNFKIGRYARLRNKLVAPKTILLPPLPCSWMILNMFILSNGKVSHCCGDSEGRSVVGDAAKESLFSIWNSEFNRELRYKHLHGAHMKDIELCRYCNASY